MARFDVHQASGAYLLDCQTDLLAHLSTRFVVPLVPAGSAPETNRLNPVFNIDGVRLVMATQLALAVPTRELGPRVGSLADEHSSIMNAFDMLLTGY